MIFSQSFRDFQSKSAYFTAFPLFHQFPSNPGNRPFYQKENDIVDPGPKKYNYHALNVIKLTQTLAILKDTI